jgi:hypothetical protein
VVEPKTRASEASESLKAKGSYLGFREGVIRRAGVVNALGSERTREEEGPRNGWRTIRDSFRLYAHQDPFQSSFEAEYTNMAGL